MTSARSMLFLACSLGSAAGTLSVQDPHLAAALPDGHTDMVLRVVFSPDGKTLASGGRDKTVRLWDVSARTLTATLTGHQAEISSLAFSPDGAILASVGRSEAIRLWDVRTGKEKAILKSEARYVDSVAFSPDGKVLASGSNNPTVELWDVATGSKTGSLQSKDPVHHGAAIAFSPDGKTLAACGGARIAWVGWWDLASGEETIPSGRVEMAYSLSFSRDGKTLAVLNGGSGRVELIDVTTGRFSATPIYIRDHHPSAVTFSPDGKLLTTGGGDQTVRIWHVSSRTLTATVRAHEESVTCVAFSPDGKLLASASVDKSIRLWDLHPRSQ